MKRTQIGWIFIVAAIVVMGIAIIQKADSKTFNSLLLVMISLIALFGTLTIKVTDKFVKFSFGIGLFFGKFKLSDIEVCNPKSYFPLGWGIRYRPGVIIFNVSGYKAIEIQRKNKYHKIWIGTNFPEEIASYINSKLEKLNSVV